MEKVINKIHLHKTLRREIGDKCTFYNEYFFDLFSIPNNLINNYQLFNRDVELKLGFVNVSNRNPEVHKIIVDLALSKFPIFFKFLKSATK